MMACKLYIVLSLVFLKVVLFRSDNNKIIKMKEKKSDVSTYGYIREELNENGINMLNEALIIKKKEDPLINIKWSRDFGEECSTGINILNDDITIERSTFMFGSQPCFIDTIITNKMCKKFEIEFIIIQLSYSSDFNFGYKYKDKHGSGPINFISASNIKSLKFGDIIKLSFDFENDTLQIYHNNNYIKQVSLNGDKSILPGISLLNILDSIQIGNYNLYN